MSRSLYRQRVTPVRIELGKNEQVALFRRYKMCKKVSYLSKVDLASVPEEYFPTHLRRRSERNLVLSKCQFSRRICLSGAQNFEPTHWTNFVAKLEKTLFKVFVPPTSPIQIVISSSPCLRSKFLRRWLTSRRFSKMVNTNQLQDSSGHLARNYTNVHTQKISRFKKLAEICLVYGSKLPVSY